MKINRITDVKIIEINNERIEAGREGVVNAYGETYVVSSVTLFFDSESSQFEVFSATEIAVFPSEEKANEIAARLTAQRKDACFVTKTVYTVTMREPKGVF